MDGDTYSEWEGVTNLLSQMQEIDNKIEVLPWAVTDQNHHNPPIAITTIACAFFDLQIYVPGLASVKANLRTRLELGDMRLSSFLLRSSVQPTQLVEKLRPWLSATRQGMWVHQLPLAEQTICIGWLLYSAPEYNLNILRRQIKQDTGIDVALRFHSISDDGSGQANCTTPRTKALHLEVDSHTSPSQLNCIERLYSAAAKTFPAGIKMRLVPARRLEINKAHVTKVGQLILLQACFLKFTETCWIGEVGSKVITQKRSLYDPPCHDTPSWFGCTTR